jgi:hypothetical protein
MVRTVVLRWAQVIAVAGTLLTVMREGTLKRPTETAYRVLIDRFSHKQNRFHHEYGHTNEGC